MAPLVSKRSSLKDPKQVEDNLDYDDSETDHTIDVKQHVVCKPLNGIEKLKRNVRWSPTLTENMLIERRIDIGQGTKLRMWYQKMDYANFELHDFDLLGEFREVFRGARIEQCEEWFVLQRNESLRGLESLDDGTKRLREIQKLRSAVLTEQRRQKDEGRFDIRHIAEISEFVSEGERDEASKRGIFDEEYCKRLVDRELRNSDSFSSFRKQPSKFDRLMRKSRRNSSHLVKSSFDSCSDDALEDEEGSVIESRFSLNTGRNLNVPGKDYLNNSINSNIEKEKAKAKKKKKSWFTVRVKKR